PRAPGPAPPPPPRPRAAGAPARGARPLGGPGRGRAHGGEVRLEPAQPCHTLADVEPDAVAGEVALQITVHGEDRRDGGERSLSHRWPQSSVPPILGGQVIWWPESSSVPVVGSPGHRRSRSSLVPVIIG